MRRLLSSVQPYDVTRSDSPDPDCWQNEWMPFQIYPYERFLFERFRS